MNRLIKSNEKSTAALIARIAIAITIFPHGAQKLFGWFGGSGFTVERTPGVKNLFDLV